MRGNSQSRGFSRALDYLRPRLLPAFFVLVGVGLIVLVSVKSFSDTPPTPTETTLYLALAGVCQVGGAAVFGRVGRVDRNHARSAVRRVISIGVALGRARQELEGSGDTRSADVLLESATRDLENSIQDWNDVYGDALNDVLAERVPFYEGAEQDG